MDEGSSEVLFKIPTIPQSLSSCWRLALGYTVFLTRTPGPDGPPAFALTNSYDAMNASASSLVVGITSMRLLMITNEFSHRTALTMHRRKYSIVLINPLVASEAWKQ